MEEQHFTNYHLKVSNGIGDGKVSLVRLVKEGKTPLRVERSGHRGTGVPGSKAPATGYRDFEALGIGYRAPCFKHQAPGIRGSRLRVSGAPGLPCSGALILWGSGARGLRDSGAQGLRSNGPPHPASCLLYNPASQLGGNLVGESEEQVQAECQPLRALPPASLSTLVANRCTELHSVW